MRRIALVALGMLLVASMAFAQSGTVGMYADQAGNACFINPQPAGLMTTYMVHVGGASATGVGFMLITGGGFTGTIFIGSITPPFLAAGTLMGGMNIGYGACTANPIMFFTILWTTTGADPACAYVKVVDNPATTFAGVEVNDCALPYANSLHAPDFTFWTGGDEGACGTCFNPVLKQSWGKIKALYN